MLLPRLQLKRFPSPVRMEPGVARLAGQRLIHKANGVSVQIRECIFKTTMLNVLIRVGHLFPFCRAVPLLGLDTARNCLHEPC